MLHHGDTEGKGFSCARGGLGNHVLPLHEEGDGAALNGGGLDVALFVNGPHELGGEPQLVIADLVVYNLAVDFHIRDSFLSVFVIQGLPIHRKSDALFPARPRILGRKWFLSIVIQFPL